jgi:hypothetical protein
MGSWSQVGQKSDSNLPILKIEGTPVRLRFIKGEGKYEGPEERWQHWPPEGDTNRSPVICIGARSGCIFHQAPIKWVKKGEDGGARLAKAYVTNVVVYEMDKGKCVGRKVLVLSGNQIYTDVAAQCAMLGVEASDYEWLIGKQGTGQTTKYTATMIGVNMIEPNGVDLSTLEDQSPEFADAKNPKLVDFDKFEGFKHRTPKQQEEWFAGRAIKGEEPVEGTPAIENTAPPSAPPATPVTSPIGTTAKPKISLPKLGAVAPSSAVPPAPVPPAPAPPAPAPPAAAGPTQEEIEAAQAKIEGWSAGSSSNPEHLNYVLTDERFDESFKEAATLLLSIGANQVTPPPAPAATNGDDLDSLKKELQSALTSLTVFKSFPNMKKFFNLAGEGKNALNALELADLQKLVPIVRQGEDAVKAAIGA